MKRTLLHCCCGPCSVGCIDSLREDGMEPTAYWYNPNIHPYQEYKARRQSLIDFAASVDMAYLIDEEYGLRTFVQAVAHDIDNRCRYCYAVRMDRAARCAAREGYDNFTTTLFISPYQDHDLIRDICESAGKKHGVPFLYRDFRPFFRCGHDEAKKRELYMQKYCGCIFSEEERYSKAIERDKKKYMAAMT